jgi:erythromycin esterase-like protein
MATQQTSFVGELRGAAIPVSVAEPELDALVELARDARVVMIGEASHGTREFYALRAELTKRLIAEQNVAAVAVEADWPDAYRVNRYVRGESDDSAESSLEDFSRFPRWMWRNKEVLKFIRWLHDHNASVADPSMRAGFYGLDLYSLHSSIEAVLSYLSAVDPPAAARARERYSCFDHYGGDPQLYGYAVSLDVSASCEGQVLQQLVDMRKAAADHASRDGRVPEDSQFFAEQNARLVTNAEEYYRSMFHGRVSSWNLRDTHMAETLEALRAHLGRNRQSPRIVLWAHNSHLGDARATQMGTQGELNVGQLVREAHGSKSFSIGFTTFAGTVTAANNWGEAPQKMVVSNGMDGSYEEIFHSVGLAAFAISLRNGSEAAELLEAPMLERAIGVIYRPRTERWSHYFEARLASQFDAVIHVDRTTALE